MANRHQRRKRAKARREQREQRDKDRAAAAERRALEDIVRANVREMRSMTPAEAEAARIQHKADAAFRTDLRAPPSGGRGSGSYLGGHTVIGPHTPSWFGQSSD
jgi:hypothetical protein